MSKSSVRITLNRQGVSEFLKSSQIERLVEERALTIANRVDGEVNTYMPGTRSVAKVTADNTNDRLLKAVR